MRIESDGTVRGTHVYNEDGSERRHVVELEIHIAADVGDDLARVTIVERMPKVSLDLPIEQVEGHLRCPHCGRLEDPPADPQTET